MMNDYQRIAKAIQFLSQRVEQQPTLDEVAAHVHLSASHFQRMFCQWAGISPKRFLQIMTLEKAKSLVNTNSSLLETSQQTGLSSTSRLYDHFVTLEAMTPGEFKSGGAQLRIEYGCHDTPFGEILIARTARGICRAVFTETLGTETLGTETGSAEPGGRQAEIHFLHTSWPKADIVENPAATKSTADTVAALSRGEKPAEGINLQVSGTNFQVAVWRALLSTRVGDTLSYSDISGRINKPQSIRAVANAIGANPVALLIPCHRVIRKSGALGGYRWGEERKQSIRFYEQLRQDALVNN